MARNKRNVSSGTSSMPRGSKAKKLDALLHAVSVLHSRTTTAPTEVDASSDAIGRVRWTANEDAALVAAVDAYGARKWKLIAQRSGLAAHGRNAKQCTERYQSNLAPWLSHDKFTPEEDAVIVSMHERVGSAWAKIACRLKGRSCNAVKNRAMTVLRVVTCVSARGGHMVLPPSTVVPEPVLEEQIAEVVAEPVVESVPRPVLPPRAVTCSANRTTICNGLGSNGNGAFFADINRLLAPRQSPHSKMKGTRAKARVSLTRHSLFATERLT